jgi:hypothetical protein
MKKLAVLSVTILFVAFVIQTQAQVKEKESKNVNKIERKALKKLEKGNVSQQAKNKFYVDFGNLPDVQWTRSENFDEATFTKDGQKMTAFYDIDANLVGTTMHKTFSDLPVKGQNEIKAKYKAYTPGTIILFDDNEANDTDMLLYGIQFDDADNYFVELANGPEKIVVQVSPQGFVSFFKKL